VAEEGAPGVDLLTIGLQLAYYALFAVSVWRLLRRRGALELAVVAVFGAFAALFALTFLNTAAPSIAPIVRPALLVIIFAQPFLVLRLIHLIRPVPRWAFVAALVGAVASTTLLVVFRTEWWATLLSVGYFFVAQLATGARLAGDGARRYGVARVRLLVAGLSTMLYGGSILIAGLGSLIVGIGKPQDPTIQLVSRLVILAAGLGYLGAFVPPGWLRRVAYRAAAFDLVQNLVAPPAGSTIGGLWEDLATTTRAILGARRVSIVADGNGPVLASVGEPQVRASEASEGEAARPRRTVVELRLGADSEPGHLLRAEVEGHPLFIEDDVALLERLGTLTARAADREAALIGLGEARRALEESAAIRASESRFRALLDAAPNAILALDEANTVTWATRQASELFGYSMSDLIGVDLADLVVLHGDSLAPENAEEDGVWRAETTGRRLDGTRFPAEIARSTFEWEGRPHHLAIISDVTWRHEADQVRERFLGVLSHELRTPVTSIYGGAQLLLARGERLGADTRRELLESVAAESERLQRMIENLVALARIERGVDFGGPRPVLVDRLMPDLVKREQELWPGVDIRLEIDHAVQLAAADEDYVAQVLRNLISNAAKYSGPGHAVTVHVEDGGPEVVVSVRDNGPGIDEAEAERLFTLYYRSSSLASAASGAGIGLFVSRELVTTMGGRIWARPLPGGGSEFGFSLPVYADEPEPFYDTPPAQLGSATVNGPTENGPAENGATSDGARPAAARQDVAEPPHNGTGAERPAESQTPASA
jgi:PAS domain S-box-containing protein